jgi:hypothetical protein
VDYLDPSDDMRIEVLQLFGWNPELHVKGATDALPFVSLEKLSVNFKARYIS